MKICGTVVAGAGRGAKLGFPTANVQADTQHGLDTGIYAGLAHIDSGTFRAAIHIGPRPTFFEDSPTIEAHLLDFNDDLYGKTMCLDVRHKLRDIKKFDTLEALRDAIQDDCKRAQELLDI